jgi:hypothetical protein
MKPTDKIANDLFQKLRTQFSPVTIGDEAAEVTSDPMQARFFSFMYTENKKELGPVSISIVNNRSLKVYYNNDMIENMARSSEWYALLKSLRFFAKQNLLSFDARDIQKDQLDARDFEFLKTNDGPYKDHEIEIAESAMFGSKRKSMQQFENSKLIVYHKKTVDEEIRGSRSRHIDTIFIESNGERFRFPINYLNGARAMAVHVSEGGMPYDDIGQHILQTVVEMQNLAKFARLTKHHATEDTEAESIRARVIESYNVIKKDIMRMQNVNNYRKFAENFKPSIVAINTDVAQLQEKFTRKIWNEKMNDLLPSVQRALEPAESVQQALEAETINEASPSVEKTIKDPNFVLVLKKDDAADRIIRTSKFTRADGLLAFIMSDIATRLIGNGVDAVANFTSAMAVDIGNEGASFGTQITPEYKRDKALAMLLAKKYLDDVKLMATDAEYASKVRKDPSDVYGAKKKRAGGYHESVEDMFAAWADAIVEATTSGTIGTTGTVNNATTNPAVVKALSGGDPAKAREIKRVSDKLAKGQRLNPQEMPVAGEIAKSVMTTKKTGAAMSALGEDEMVFEKTLRVKSNPDEEKASKDYDGDGEIESPKDEYMGSKDRAIRRSMKKEDDVEDDVDLVRESLALLLKYAGL